jgi:hypothetical protein
MQVYRRASNRQISTNQTFAGKNSKIMGKLGANVVYNGRKKILTHPHRTRVPFSAVRKVRMKQMCRALSELQ